MPDGDIARFDRLAARYDRHYIQWFARRIHPEVVAAVAPTPASVLDVGCGTGVLLQRLGERWPSARLSGLDAAPGMVGVAAGRLAQADVRLGFAESLPWPDATFDLVTTSLSFHHWRDKAAGIREAARVLRPSGQFILADVGGDGFTGAAARFFGQLTRSDEEFLPSARVAALMIAAGLGEVRVQPLLRGHFRLISARRLAPQPRTV